MKRKICYWLDSNETGIIPMREGRIYACCTRAVPILIDKQYYYDELSLNDIQKNRIALYEAINNGTAPQCEGCSCLVEKEEKDIDIGKIGYLIYHPHTTCNLKCRYCFFQKNEQLVKLDHHLVDLYAAVKNFHEIGLLKADFSLEIGGGEPLLMDNIDKTIKFLEENYPKSTFVLVSNYTLSSKVDMLLDILKDRKIKTILKTSVDCGTKESYKDIRQYDGFDQMKNNLIRSAKAGIFDTIYLKYILMEDKSNTNTKNVKGFINLVNEIKNINSNETKIIIDADMLAFTEGNDYFKTNENSEYTKFKPKRIKNDMMKAAKYIYKKSKQLKITIEWTGDRLSGNTQEGLKDIKKIEKLHRNYKKFFQKLFNKIFPKKI